MASNNSFLWLFKDLIPSQVRRPHPLRVEDTIGNKSRPHPGDMPLDGVRRSEEFARVLTGWLKTDSERNTSRVRFNDLLDEPWHYTLDKLVSAANMFPRLQGRQARCDCVFLSG